MPSSRSHIDPDIFARIAQGDEVAFRKLFDDLKAPFFAAAFKMTREQSLAEEIVQDVFVACWTQRAKIAEAMNPQAYVFTILHHHIYTHFKQIAHHRQQRLAYASQQDQHDNHTAEDILLAKENHALLDSLIQKLPTQQQKVYLLAKREGLSREAIAEALQISPNTVKNHLKAATDAIREALKNNGSTLVWIAIWQSL